MWELSAGGNRTVIADIHLLEGALFGVLNQERKCFPSRWKMATKDWTRKANLWKHMSPAREATNQEMKEMGQRAKNV